MYQMVFVVNDKYAQRIIGVYNEFPDALKAAKDYTKGNYTGYEISITPVTVDLDNPANGARSYALNEQEVMDAVQDEMDLAYDDWIGSANEPEAEAEADEDEDEDEYVDEDEDDDVDDPEDEPEEDEEDVDDLIDGTIDEIAELIGDLIRKVTGR